MPVTTWAVCDRNPRTPRRRCRTPRRTRRTYRSVREHPQEVPRHPGGQCSRACVQAVEDAVAAVGRRVEGLHPPHRAGPRCPPDGSRRSHRPGTLRVRAGRGAELHGRGPTPPEHAPQRTTGDGDMTPEGVHGLGVARQLSPSLGPRTAQRCPGPVLPGPVLLGPRAARTARSGLRSPGHQRSPASLGRPAPPIAARAPHGPSWRRRTPHPSVLAPPDPTPVRPGAAGPHTRPSWRRPRPTPSVPAAPARGVRAVSRPGVTRADVAVSRAGPAAAGRCPDRAGRRGRPSCVRGQGRPYGPHRR